MTNITSNGVRAGDAATTPSKFFWTKYVKIWAKFGQIWAQRLIHTWLSKNDNLAVKQT